MAKWYIIDVKESDIACDSLTEARQLAWVYVKSGKKRSVRIADTVLSPDKKYVTPKSLIGTVKKEGNSVIWVPAKGRGIRKVDGGGRLYK